MELLDEEFYNLQDQISQIDNGLVLIDHTYQRDLDELLVDLVHQTRIYARKITEMYTDSRKSKQNSLSKLKYGNKVFGQNEDVDWKQLFQTLEEGFDSPDNIVSSCEILQYLDYQVDIRSFLGIEQPQSQNDLLSFNQIQEQVVEWLIISNRIKDKSVNIMLEDSSQNEKKSFFETLQVLEDRIHMSHKQPPRPEDDRPLLLQKIEYLNTQIQDLQQGTDLQQQNEKLTQDLEELLEEFQNLKLCYEKSCIENKKQELENTSLYRQIAQLELQIKQLRDEKEFAEGLEDIERLNSLLLDKDQEIARLNHYRKEDKFQNIIITNIQMLRNILNQILYGNSKETVINDSQALIEEFTSLIEEFQMMYQKQDNSSFKSSKQTQTTNQLQETSKENSLQLNSSRIEQVFTPRPIIKDIFSQLEEIIQLLNNKPLQGSRVVYNEVVFKVALAENVQQLVRTVESLEKQLQQGVQQQPLSPVQKTKLFQEQQARNLHSALKLTLTNAYKPLYELQEGIEEKERIIQELNHKILQYEEEIKCNQEQIDENKQKFKEENDQQKELLFKLQQDIQKRTGENKEQKQMIDQQRSQNKELQQQLQNQRKKFEVIVDRLGESEDYTKSVENTQENQRSIIEDFQKQCSELRNENAQLQRAMSDLKGQFEANKIRNDHTIKTQQQNLIKAQKENQDLKNDRQLLEDKLDEMKNQNDNLEINNKDKDSSIIQLQDQTMKLKSSLNRTLEESKDYQILLNESRNDQKALLQQMELQSIELKRHTSRIQDLQNILDNVNQQNLDDYKRFQDEQRQLLLQQQIQGEALESLDVLNRQQQETIQLKDTKIEQLNKRILQQQAELQSQEKRFDELKELKEKNKKYMETALSGNEDQMKLMEQHQILQQKYNEIDRFQKHQAKELETVRQELKLSNAKILEQEKVLSSKMQLNEQEYTKAYFSMKESLQKKQYELDRLQQSYQQMVEQTELLQEQPVEDNQVQEENHFQCLIEIEQLKSDSREREVQLLSENHVLKRNVQQAENKVQELQNYISNELPQQGEPDDLQELHSFIQQQEQEIKRLNDIIKQTKPKMAQTAKKRT